MPKEAEIKAQLEKILDHDLGPGAGINLIAEVALFSRSEGFTTWTTFGERFNKCRRTELLDVSGYARTGSDGTIRFRLASFHCPSDTSPSPDEPINVLATPFSSTPCFLTMTHSVKGRDVEIEVLSWDVNGAAAPHVSFNWRCRSGLLYPLI